MILQTLGAIRSHSDLVVPYLIHFASHSESDLRFTAISEMVHFTDQSKALLPVLIHALDDPHDQIKMQSLKVIGEYGPLAGSIVSDLVRLLRIEEVSEDNEAFQREMTATLGKIGEAANAYWMKTLSSNQVDDRVSTIQALKTIGDKAVPALPF